MDYFRTINDDWFLSEPLLFRVLCTHRLQKKYTLKVPMRTGKMCIEYNPYILQEMDPKYIVEFLKMEIIRVLLKHPYQRQPYKAVRSVLAMSSNFTILENYKSNVDFPRAKNFGFPENLSFEEYYKLLLEHYRNLDCLSCSSSENEDENEGSDCENGNNSNENGQEFLEEIQELSELWEEDSLSEITINEHIRQAQQDKSWGCLPGNIVGMIEASLIVRLDYRKILRGFRKSVVSNQRKLTRMRPSRRYGFQYMGSKYDFTTNLLVAVDLSGSVGDRELQEFFSVINRFFKYGIKQIDVIQFDEIIQGEVIPFKKAQKEIKIKGRGGTNFQPVFDYLCDNPFYDGMLVFTDGGAPKPRFKKPIKIPILWVLDNKENYESAKNWIEKMPRSKAMFIP